MIDLIGSFLLLLILSPLMVTIPIIIFINMGPPILFKQLRTGLKGKPFYLYKFRTMTEKYDEKMNLLPGRLRLTKLGILLRKYSLDELPQLFNVIKGEISLVGPRPLLVEYLPLYTKEQARRHDVKPGITGWAQINGRNAINWDEKFALDLWYIDNHSIYLDLKILVLTFFKVLKKEGIGAENHHSMERYKGKN